MKSLNKYMPVTLAVMFLFCVFPQSGMALEKNAEQKINALENKIKKLEKDHSQVLLEDVDEINERLDDVERKTLMDKINFGAEVRSRFDWFGYKDNDNDATDDYMLPSIRFRLNLRSAVSRNLKFNARLSVMQNWNDEDWDESIFARYRGGSNLMVERAYMDYFFDFAPMALTIGRLPLGDGLPTNFRENTPRKSTYPAVTWDSEGDGIGLSFNLEELVHLPNAAFRLVYITLVDDNDSNSLIYDVDIKKGTGLNADEEASSYYLSPDNGKNYSVYMGQVETELSGALQGTLLIANFLYIPVLVPPSLAQINDIMRSAVETNPQAIVGAVESIMPFLDLDADTLALHDVTFTNEPDTMGTLQSASVYVHSERFLKLPLDWFASFTYQNMSAKGDLAEYSVSMSAIDANLGLMPLPLPVSQGMYSDEGTSESKTATGFYLGGRVHIPISFLNTPKLGFEYNSASQYYFPKNFTPEDPLFKLNTAGTALDVYYIQPIDKNFYIRVGHTIINRNYDSSSFYFGDRAEIDRTVTNTYFLLDMKF